VAKGERPSIPVLGTLQDPSDMGTMIRVATVNILNDLSRWGERRTLLARGLAASALDLIALQEVTDPLGYSTAHWLAGELGGYTVHVCPKAGWGRSREGVALLSRLPVERHETIDLLGQQRTAQLLRVSAGGRPVVVVNTHLYWPPGAHAARVRQVERLLAWVGASEPGVAVVACGDFNATPGSRAIALMRRSFTSAHETARGHEPEFTCPTPLAGGGRFRGAVTRGLLRLFSNRPGASWRGTLDYIFVSPGVWLLECGVILDRPSPDDPTLYASDHLGLAATLEITASDSISPPLSSVQPDLRSPGASFPRGL
jgi:endonuclease/exonuclease/phosphatase family metal-dependent hydrolase